MTTTTTTTPIPTTANIAHTSPITTAFTPMATAQATVIIHTATTRVHDRAAGGMKYLSAQ